MATRLPNALPRRPTAAALPSLLSPSCTQTASTRRAFSSTPAPNADIIRRPRRPYTFTQLVQLSDGSTYTQRTTSPLGLYKSTKDTRNHIVWQPNEKSLRNVEVDEAGKLAAFRGRFGRGWDAESRTEEEDKGAVEAGDGGVDGGGKGEGDKMKEKKLSTGTESEDALSDLIAGYSRPEDEIKEKKVPLKKGKK